MLTLEREVNAPVVMSDLELDHWAHVYMRLDLYRTRGYTFEQFLKATPQVRADAEQSAALVLADMRQVRQRAVQRRLDLEAKSAYSIAARLTPRDHQALKRLYEGFSARGNGERIEKLRHRRWPRSRRRDFVVEES